MTGADLVAGLVGDGAHDGGELHLQAPVRRETLVLGSRRDRDREH